MARDNGKEAVSDLYYVNSFLEGNEKSFELLVEMYYKRVYNLCFRFFNNAEEARDAAQEVFLKAFRYLKNFRQDSSFYTWLHKLTVNHCITTVNSKKKFWDKCKEYFTLTFLPRSEIPVYDPLKLAEEKEFYADLKEAVTKLPPEFRMAVILRDIENLSYEEIAEKLEVSVGTVKSRISRGRGILRTLLAHHRGEAS